MMKRDRQEQIIKLINENNRMSYAELINATGISEATLRRDLNELHQHGLVRLVRGGAESVSSILGRGEEQLGRRYNLFTKEKDQIGRYAASLIKPYDLVFIDSGSTTEKMCKHITERKATYITIGLKHAMILSRAGLNASIAPGRIKQLTDGLQGCYTLEFLRKFNFTIAFFGAFGITVKRGISTTYGEDAVIKGAVLDHCPQNYLLSDHSKFGIDAPVTFCKFDGMTIITTKGDHLAPYLEQGHIVQVDEDEDELV